MAAVRPVDPRPSGPTVGTWCSREGPPVKIIVEVMLKPEILDPQGAAVLAALPRLGMTGVRSVRQGKRFELDVDGEPDIEQTHRIADGLLSNPVIEDYT